MKQSIIHGLRLLLRRCFRNGSKFSSKTQSLVSELARKSGLSLYQQKKLSVAADGITAPSSIERWGNGLPKRRSVMPMRHRSAPVGLRRSSLSTSGKNWTARALYFSELWILFSPLLLGINIGAARRNMVGMQNLEYQVRPCINPIWYGLETMQFGVVIRHRTQYCKCTNVWPALSAWNNCQAQMKAKATEMGKQTQELAARRAEQKERSVPDD